MPVVPPYQYLPTAAFICYSALLTSASRAYPHGCLYRHPSYYTYDERDEISWKENELEEDDVAATAAGYNNNAGLEQFTDFRNLPPKSSRFRRPYERYRLTRRLGAGKFSDVFEAVDIQHEEWSKAERDRRKRRIRDIAQEGEESEGGGVKVKDGRCGETTDGEMTDADNNNGRDDDKADEGVVDPESLVVLKCLKPVSERKIRRELLVLTHCFTLPNVARLIGIVIPESMDDNNGEEQSSLHQQRETAPVQTTKKRRRRHAHHLQREENIGSITDAAASVELARRKKAAAAAAQAKSNHDQNKNNQQHGTQLPALVLEHAGQHSQWFCHGQQQQKLMHIVQNENHYLSEYEMKYYLCHLLIALDGLHSAGIMHRDVKPRNTLINRFLPDEDKGENDEVLASSPQLQQQQQSKPRPALPPPPLMLVDLGLADFYLPGKEYNVRVASRHYKSPELLIGFEYYDYAIDMWSIGCILAGLLFRREPFFRGKDNEDQLGKIVSVLGTRDFLPYCRKCNVRLSSNARAAIGKYCSKASSSSSSSDEGPPSLLNNDMGRRKPWLSFLSLTCPIPSVEALDLLDKLLVYDHEQRWTAREALGHTFFDDVREKVLREVQQRITLESQWRSSLMQQR